MGSQNESFSSWAIIELFGHQRIAGLVSEQTIGGASFIRIDVPENESVPAFTRFLGAASIYAINPCTEDLARRAAGSFLSKPIQAYEIRALPAPVRSLDEDHDSSYPGDDD